eukprot:gnl/Dysnectes_brevis/377_a419_4777.p1 GENE.gnl/Dysnectes_brevis/377_a419_4777~~gnl/Dysnectes_brevis/377_a419_4777.p1  ORF type:complete len:439 (+),score=115.29 gnl/Dysnectes_brevis/377_a419_4777:55-1371(+)
MRNTSPSNLFAQLTNVVSTIMFYPIMFFLIVVILAAAHVDCKDIQDIFSSSDLPGLEPFKYTPQQYVEMQGFQLLEFSIVTEDDYILTLWRLVEIGEPTFNLSSRPPLLLVHGILENGMTWIYNNRSTSPGYQFHDEGFDVWIINCRGTTFSQHHQYLDYHEDEYWNYSFDEIAHFDIPCALDALLEHSEWDQAQIVAFSQGSSATIAALSSPQLSLLDTSKLSGTALLCPVTRFQDPTFEGVGILTLLPEGITQDLIYEIFGVGAAFIRSDMWVLTDLFPIMAQDMPTEVAELVQLVVGPDTGKVVDWDTFHVDTNFLPDSASVRALVHYFQMIGGDAFTAYDWGIRNIEVYGHSETPVYDPSLMPTDIPVFVLSGTSDAVAVHDDVEWFISRMEEGGVDYRWLELDGYMHLGLTVGDYGPDDAWPQLIDFLVSNLS